MNQNMFSKPSKPKKHFPPGLSDDVSPGYRLSRAASDSDTESISSGFIPVEEETKKQEKTRGLNNNDELHDRDLQPQDLNSAYIYSWVPRLVDGELCIEGDLVDLDDEDDDTNSILAERFTTGPVVQRVNGVIFKTRNKTYVLEGQMAVGVIEAEKNVDTPYFIRDKFNSCVPENWNILVKQWIHIRAKNIQNRHTMAMIYESMRSFTSASLIPVEANQEINIRHHSSSDDDSEISACTTKPQQKALNLSINKQTIIDIRPCEKVETGHLKIDNVPSSEDEDPLTNQNHGDDDALNKKELVNYDEIEEIQKFLKKYDVDPDDNEEPAEEPEEDDSQGKEHSKRKLDKLTPRKKRTKGLVHPEDDDKNLDDLKRENVDHVESEQHPEEDDFRSKKVSKRKVKPREKRTTAEVDLEDDRMYCKSCNVTFINYHYHYKSAYHGRVVEEQEKFPELVGPMEDYDAQMGYACKPCRFSTDDEKTIRLHVALYNHKMKISKKDKIVLFCNLCNFSCKSNDKFHIHIDNKSHAQQQENSCKTQATDNSFNVSDVILIPQEGKKRNWNHPLVVLASEENRSSSSDEDFL